MECETPILLHQQCATGALSAYSYVQSFYHFEASGVVAKVTEYENLEAPIVSCSGNKEAFEAAKKWVIDQWEAKRSK